jgi:NitT/TauT family transport system substrate-binding protein
MIHAGAFGPGGDRDPYLRTDRLREAGPQMTQSRQLFACRTQGALAFLLALALGALLWDGSATASDRLRISVLKFGTASWALWVIKDRHLDQAEGTALEVTELGSPQATLVALQSGATDLSVSDWLWVVRQRTAGRPFTFVPYSTATGALLVAGDSPVASLKALSGKRVGVAGGPLDKSWLVLRALSLKQDGVDIASQVEPVYGAPPLLNQEILHGRIDAVLNYWPYAARLTATGFRPLVQIQDAIEALGIDSRVPMVGYVFDEHLGSPHREARLGFFRALRKAQALLQTSDEEWERLRPLMGAPDQATFEALKAQYRAGIPRHWGAAERRDADKLFLILRKLGGKRLVGDATQVPPGTFWAEVSY